MPKPGTMCETDLGPFDSIEEGSVEDSADAQGRLHKDMDEDDKLLLRAIRKLSSSQFTNFYPSFSMLPVHHADDMPLTTPPSIAYSVSADQMVETLLL